MTKWNGAFGYIKRRNIVSVLESIAVDLPFSFDAVNDRSDIPDFLESNWELISSTYQSLISLPGREINFARDLLISASKFLHVIECSKSQIQSGAMTWGVVDSYHAALLGARLISAQFGIIMYNVKGRTVLVDFRPNCGSVDDQRRFSKEARGYETPVRVLCPQPKHLEQSDLWALIVRLSNIAEWDDNKDQSEALKQIVSTIEQPISAFRNAIIYDAVEWEWRDDFSKPVVATPRRRRLVFDQDGTHTLTLNMLSQIFGFTKSHLTVLGKAIGYDPTRLSPLFAFASQPEQLLGP